MDSKREVAAAINSVTEVTAQTTLLITSMLREEKLRQLEAAKQQDEEIPQNGLESQAIPLRRTEILKYAACVKIEQMLSKSVQKATVKAFRKVQEGTFMPQDLNVGSWLSLEKSINGQKGTFTSFADKLCDIATSDGSPTHGAAIERIANLPNPTKDTSISDFASQILNSFLGQE